MERTFNILWMRKKGEQNTPHHIEQHNKERYEIRTDCSKPMKTRSMVPCRYIFPFVVAIPLFNYYYELFVSYLLWVSDFCIAKKCMRAVARSNSWIDTKMDISYSYTNLAPPRTTCHLLIITIIESLLIVDGNNQRMEFFLLTFQQNPTQKEPNPPEY